MSTKRIKSNAKSLKPVKPNDPLLPPDLQGRRYKVIGFMVTPELSILTADGLEDKRIWAPVGIQVLRSGFGKSVSDLTVEAKMKMESD